MKITCAQLLMVYVKKTHIKFRQNWLNTVGGEAHTKFVPYMFYMGKVSKSNNSRKVDKSKTYLQVHNLIVEGIPVIISAKLAENCRRRSAHKIEIVSTDGQTT